MRCGRRLPLRLALWASGLATLAASAKPCEDVAAVACIQWLEKVGKAARLSGVGVDFPLSDRLGSALMVAPFAHLRVDSASQLEFRLSARSALGAANHGIYAQSESPYQLLLARFDSSGSIASETAVLYDGPVAISESNQASLIRQALHADNPAFARARAVARVGIPVAALLTLVGAEMLATSKCVLSSTCGGCRSVYIAVNSGDPTDTYQGPYLQLNREASKASFEYGQICRTFADIIQTNKAAGAMLGSSPNTVGTGVEGALVYDILNLENKPTGCSLRIEVDSGAGLFSKAFGENDDHQPKVSFRGGTKCNPDLRYDVTQVIPGSIGQMYLYVWFQSELARLRPPPGLGF